MSVSKLQLIVRPPWRDELDRVPDFVRGLRQFAKSWNSFVLVADKPERIVGLAGVSSEENQGLLHFRLRPRILHEGGGNLLLEAVKKKAVELGVENLVSQVSVGSVEESFFKESGFDVGRTEEIWRVDLIKVKNRLDKISKKWKPSPDWQVRGISSSDLPKIAKLIEPYNRLSPDRLRLREEHEAYGNAYEAEASSVVECNGNLLGALLCKGSAGLNGYIEFRVVGQEFFQYSGILSGMMLHRSVIEAIKLDYGTVSFTVNVDKDAETRNLAKRMGGVLTNNISMWTYKL